MPGNEVGDRIHNFFGQESLSQGQHQSQVVDGAWPGLSNNLWAASQRQIGASLISNLKNHNGQQSVDSELGHGGQTSSVQHGMDFPHSSPRPEFGRSLSQGQQPTLNGYMHGHPAFQSRQNEANFLGVDTESDQHAITSKGFSIVDSQLANGPEHHKKNSAMMDFTESPVNYDFFGGQQQINSQHHGVLQSLSRQQSGVSDMQQLLQQQFMLKQMQEIQRQQQFQNQQLPQQEVRELNSLNQGSTFAKQAAGSHSQALINGIPVQDASNYSWQPEHMAANTNWMQRGASPVTHESFSGHMFLPEQGQGPRLMGMVPQQVDQSLYGVPISGTRVTASQYSPVQMDKPMMQQISSSNNSFLGNQFPGIPDQVSVQDVTLVSRQGYKGKNMIGTADGQGLNSRFNLENLQQVNHQQSNGLVQEFHGRQELAGPSETSQEKSVMQFGPSQSVATLDPTEEKILFGSDDNLWDAFGGGANIGSGGYNMLDGTDFSGAFPSVQSGSWSALMQSAVAETSSADIGLQEEWSGLTLRNNKPSAANSLTQSVKDSGKYPSAWPDNNLQTASTVDPKPFPQSDETNSNMNYNNIQGGQHSGVNISDEQSERLETGSRKFGMQFPVDGTKWLDCSFQQKVSTEGGHSYGKVTPDAESNPKSISSSWTNQQRMPVYRMDSQLISRPNGWNFIDPGLPSTSAALKNQENENLLQVSQTQSADQKAPMFEAMGHGAGIWMSDSVSNSSLELEHAKSAIGSPQVNKDDYNQESSQQPPNGNNMDIWKHVDSSANPKASESSGKYQSYMDRSHQTFESSRNISVGNGAVETHEIQNSNIKENASDRFRNVSQPSANTGLRENARLDASDSGTLLGGKRKSSSHAGRKPSGIRKFQYHPMGDLDADVEPPHGTKQVAHSQSTPQQVSQGLAQPKFPSHITRNPLEIDKGCLSGFQGETKSLDDIPSKSMLPGSAPSTSAPFDRAVCNYQPNRTTTSSQKMLELLRKVDQSSERGNATHFSSSNCSQSSEMPQAETLDASVHHQQNQSSASQGFGLQLAPPSQLLPVPDHAFSSQNPSQENNTIYSTHVSSDTVEKGYAWLAPTSSVQFLPPSHETSQGQLRNNISSTSEPTGNNAQRNFSAAFSSAFPHPRSHLQNQHMSGSGGPATTSQSVNVSFDRFPSKSKQMSEPLERSHSTQSASASVPDMSRNAAEEDFAPSVDVSQQSNHKQKHARDSAQQFPVLEASAAPKIPPAIRTNVSTLQHPFGARPFKTPSSMLRPNPQSNNNSETALSRPQKLEDQNAQTGGSGPENNLAQKTLSAAQGKESVTNHLAGSSLSSPTCTQKEIEAFGRSLRPNNILHQNYSLSHQEQGMKSLEGDPANRSLKRFRSLDGVVDAQLGPTQGGQQFHGHSDIVRDAPINRSAIPSGDANMLSFSAKPTDDCDAGAPSQDMLAFGRSDSQNFTNNNSAVSVRGENSQVSPQMAPSWFEQYGTFKNGQILSSMYDSRKIATMSASEMPFTIGRSSDRLHVHGSVEQGNAAASQCGIVQKSLISVASENFSTLQLLHPGASDVSLAVVKPKKRKSVASELIPWHKEVLQGPPRLQNLSAAEANWSLAANRLTEKVEDEGEIVDDGLPVLKSKRRLILTTQLMQLLFCPPPASILSAEAISYYDSAAYCLTRSTLGDACSAISCSGSDTPVPFNGRNNLPEKLKASERISDQYFSKVMEDLINRGRKLESDLLRLDKRATVLDLRVECQDLEKYSVINRFAKFHGRGQADGAENSSSCDASANAQKACPQRYVTALPIPRNLPDRVQCLSL